MFSAPRLEEVSFEDEDLIIVDSMLTTLNILTPPMETPDPPSDTPKTPWHPKDS